MRQSIFMVFTEESTKLLQYQNPFAPTSYYSREPQLPIHLRSEIFQRSELSSIRISSIRISIIWHGVQRLLLCIWPLHLEGKLITTRLSFGLVHLAFDISFTARGSPLVLPLLMEVCRWHLEAFSILKPAQGEGNCEPYGALARIVNLAVLLAHSLLELDT